MDEKRQQALQLISEMLPPEFSNSFQNGQPAKTFADEIGELALTNVFARLWTRPGH